ncbi:oxidoreductase [Aureimonas sp. SA4125]|uniref:SDR family NAD(P)-dependent oxidoreductase n=1 Tax=Aureimonas sp. SA4125 TaxID=2826993 RepID=UPI001CC70756|nr:SDR family NAD(P)-dependent oxidoreductase [Aureimonas sp. SA4125]BDA82583.1 oxidoreductase [Aureimonas sp. SA4125]
MTHSLLVPGNTALITGGAAGIGLATATRLVALGLKVCLVDRDEAKLADAAATLKALSGAQEDGVIAVAADVADRAAMEAVADMIFERWGTIHVLMNNAGIQPGSGILGPREAWDTVLQVNLGGVVNGVQVFVPRMIARGEGGVVINTGSKQGITTPPGDPAYNVAKAGVKVLTEALQHEFRNMDGGLLSAHLLIPGFVFTGLTAGDRTEKPAGAWTPEQTADFMLEKLEAGDFYILCPDGEVTRAMDEKRIAWAAGDITENRPPLSRWHTDWADKFKAWARG